MEPFQTDSVSQIETRDVSRRTAIGRLVIGGTAAALFAQGHAAAQVATPAAGECVATAPPAEDGIGLASLLVGGIVHDMPAGPVEVRITRFTLEPGASVPPGTLPYPALMYIETGESTCPGNPGKIMYGADGAVLHETTGEAEGHVCPAGTTWYIPGGIEDAALNEGTELMSSLIIEFVPVELTATPTI
jgi:quercetin dioxygenase-like cupin family protein